MPTTPPSNISPGHPEQHPGSSVLFTDVVIGMNDGLTVPFALAAGLSGALYSNHIIVVACLCTIAAGSIAMGMGGYLAGKAAQAQYHNEQGHTSAADPHHHEQEETRQLLEHLGLDTEVQQQAAEEITQDKDRWTALRTQYELETLAPHPKRARNSAVNIGLSYAAGGLVPLSPYFFMGNATDALKVSALVTLVCLFVFGFFKSRIMGAHPWVGALRVMLTGALAAACAFGIAKLIAG